MRLARAPLIALLMTSGLASAAPVEGPVAVMPFKNLAQDPELEWLRVGMSETLLADLKRSGARVVERDQLDKALMEISLQGARGTDESTAARAGKMVGAKTVVLGAFQKAGKEVRITARFVAVETGVVQDATKVTGPLTRIFHLQDEIISRLLGEAPSNGAPKSKSSAASRRRPEPRDGEKTLKAYRLYAMAASTASDADRVGYLRDALEVDPGFTYAADDLAALEKRLKDYREQGARATAQEADDTLSYLKDASKPAEERAAKAVQVMGKLSGSMEYVKLERFARAVRELNLPATQWVDPTESATAFLFLALELQHRTSEALQVGEYYLKTYPSGRNRMMVEPQMSAIVNQQQLRNDRLPEYRKALEDAEGDRREAEAHAATTHRPIPRVLRMSLDSRRCTTAHSFQQYDDVIAWCPTFAQTYATEADETTVQMVFLARWFTAQAYAQKGELKKARALAEELMAKDPARARQFAIPTVSSMWPRE